MSNISHVDKPSWLRSFLDSLQFQIFTWHIDIGGPIETAFDWLFAPLNGFIDWLNFALNWIEQAWDWVLDRIKAFFDPWIYIIRDIWNTLSTLWSKISDWFSGLVSDIQDWVSAFIQETKDLILSVGQYVTELWNRVTDFFTSILPTLASKLDVSGAIAAAFVPWRDLFNFWGSFGREVATFFTNPLDWIMDKFEQWFFGG